MSTPENVIWGELFKPNSKPILRVKSGDRIVMQTVSHEGILPDQGDTVEYLTKAGIRKEDILPDRQPTVNLNQSTSIPVALIFKLSDQFTPTSITDAEG
jgi:hypothetical protein